jgi:hypothetical protein
MCKYIEIDSSLDTNLSKLYIHTNNTFTLNNISIGTISEIHTITY